MSLVKCPECGHQVSNAAKACPSCGFADLANATHVMQHAGEPLAEVWQSWWHYFGFLLFSWLLIPWFIAWWQRSSQVLRIFPGRVVLTRGMLAKSERELFVHDIRSIDIQQTLLGRLVDIGTLTISTAATVDAYESLAGIRHPQKIRDLIIAQR